MQRVKEQISPIPYRFVSVTGVGNSGKGAVTDILREFAANDASDFSWEFDLLRITDGLLDLYHHVCEDWSPVRSHEAVRRFHKLVVSLGVDPQWYDLPGLFKSSSNRYDRRFNHRFVELSTAYVASLIKGSYTASWPFDWIHESNGRRFLRKVANRIGLRRWTLSDVALVDASDFRQTTNRYLQTLFKERAAKDVKSIILNNSIEPFSPLRSLDLIEGSRLIVVLRDPRDIYVSGLNAHNVSSADKHLMAFDNNGINKSFLGTDDLKKFVLRYRIYMSKLYCGDDPRILRLNFEDLVTKYEPTLKQLFAFLQLSPGQHTYPKKHFDPERSRKNVGIWATYSKQEDIRYIEAELKDYTNFR